MAFAKRSRLSVPDFFNNIKKQRILALSYDGLSLKAMRNGLGRNRFAIIISTKVHKNATKRNALRRTISSPLENVPQRGIDVLVTLAPGIVRKKKDIEVLVRKAWQDIESHIVVTKP